MGAGRGLRMAPLDRMSPRLFRRSLALGLVLAGFGARAEFRDDFNGPAIEGWFTLTGDGVATVEFEPHEGFARVEVDATQDHTNVWWAIIKRDIAAYLDLHALQDPAYELRVEARVRPSHAPRRVNFMINTQRTTDFHEHLREYDLEEADGWRTISMTTRNLDAGPGDTVNVQLGVTDWGTGRFHVDVDYYRASVVRVDQAGPDLGEPLVYHPPVPELGSFLHHLEVAHDSIVHPSFADVNFNEWLVRGAGGAAARILTVDAQQSVVLRWDFSAFQAQKAAGAGVLELTTQSVARGGNYVAVYGEDLGIEFGKLRVIEILGGDPDWRQDSVTYRNLLAGGKPEEVFNGQMIFDTDVAEAADGKTFVTLPRPVMQRLLDGRTRGLILRPLGAIVPSLYASEDDVGRGPRLHFSTTR